MGSAIAPWDEALVSFYNLSSAYRNHSAVYITVWLWLAMQISRSGDTFLTFNEQGFCLMECYLRAT